MCTFMQKDRHGDKASPNRYAAVHVSINYHNNPWPDASSYTTWCSRRPCSPQHALPSTTPVLPHIVSYSPPYTCPAILQTDTVLSAPFDLLRVLLFMNIHLIHVGCFPWLRPKTGRPHPSAAAWCVSPAAWRSGKQGDASKVGEIKNLMCRARVMWTNKVREKVLDARREG